MTALVLSILAASLLGSVHCAAMCGGFACFFSGERTAGPAWMAHAAYHGARLVGYLALGAAAGLAGAGFDLAGRMAGLQRPAAIAAGAVMILWGGASLAAAAGIGRAVTAAPGATRFLSRRIAALTGKPPLLRALGIGLLTALLPCGWLYVFVATAAGTGSPQGGALAMAAFWVGTVPALAGVGLLAQKAIGPLRARLPVVTAAALLVLGVLTVAGRFHGSLPGSPAAMHDHH